MDKKRWKSTEFVQGGVNKVTMGEEIPIIDFSFVQKAAQVDINSFLQDLNTFAGSDILDIETDDPSKINIQNIVRQQRFSQDVENGFLE